MAGRVNTPPLEFTRPACGPYERGPQASRVGMSTPAITETSVQSVKVPDACAAANRGNACGGMASTTRSPGSSRKGLSEH